MDLNIKKQNLVKIKQYIINVLSDKYAKNIAITCHLSPDGDALGSAISLALALSSASFNKKVDIIIPSYSSNFLPVIKNVNIVKDAYKTYDLCFLLDCSDKNRTINSIDDISKCLIVIDHHIDSSPIGNIYLCDNKASTTMILFDMFKTMNVLITSDIATALYLGIFSDTSGFSNFNVTDEVHSMTAELINLGANINLVHNICKAKTLAMSKLMYELLSRLEYDEQYRIVYLVLLREDLYANHVSYDIVDFLMEEMKNIKEADVALLFIESKNDTKIKARSKGNIQINHIMGYFNGNLYGGSHKNASGAMIDSVNIYNIVDSVLSRTKMYLDEHPEERN